MYSGILVSKPTSKGAAPMTAFRILREIYKHEYAILRAHSGQCQRQYLMTLSRWAEQLGTDPALEHLEPLIVQTYIAKRRAERSAATARKDRNQISALWTYCAKRRYVEQFPTLAQIKAPGRIPRGYTAADVSALLREALRKRPPIRGTSVPAHFFLATLIRCCWETAERACRVARADPRCGWRACLAVEPRKIDALAPLRSVVPASWRRQPRIPRPAKVSGQLHRSRRRRCHAAARPQQPGNHETTLP
ncbi:hypothetical protein EB077_11195 [bacterium]|nr:hypothetical protein [bacterium]